MENFERIYDTYAAAVFRLSMLYLCDKHEAEDVTQECFIRLWQKESFVSETHIKAWLLTVARNLSFNTLKKRNRHVPLNEFLPATENTCEVMLELYKLSPDDRAVAYLFYYEKYTSIEISKLLKTTDNAVRSRLKRIRAELKNYLQEYEYV